MARRPRSAPLGKLATKSKVHVTLGHATVMATVTFFGYEQLAKQAQMGGSGDGVSHLSGVLGSAVLSNTVAVDGATAGVESDSKEAGEDGGAADHGLHSSPNALGQFTSDPRFDFASVPFDWGVNYEHQVMPRGRLGASWKRRALFSRRTGLCAYPFLYVLTGQPSRTRPRRMKCLGPRKVQSRASGRCCSSRPRSTALWEGTADRWTMHHPTVTVCRARLAPFFLT